MKKDIDDLSIGISPIVKVLSDKNIQKYFKFNVFLINIATLFRNNLNKNVSISQLKKDVESDINILVSYFKEMHNNYKLMIFYLCNYLNYIPQDILRNTKFTQILKDIYSGKIKLFNNVNTPNYLYNSKSDNIDIISIYIENYKMINYLSPIINENVVFPKIALLSNIAWDFLIFKKYKGAIIESFSGKIIEKNQIPLKVFKNKYIPFNELTYRLLGDKALFKPLLVRNKKAEFYKLAEKERFDIITLNKLKSILTKNKIVEEKDIKNNFIIKKEE